MTHGVRLSAVITPNGTMILGCGVTPRNFDPRCIPLTLGQRRPSAFLWLAYVLKMDPEQRYLAVAKSSFNLYLDADLEQMVFHYDYEREPAHGYPPAHFQVAGDARELSAIAEERGYPRKQLKDFHFPVGGRRYRPSLEDVIEFLVLEDIADARDDWSEVIQEGRTDWEDKQLRAAVRRNPEAALAQLREDGVI